MLSKLRSNLTYANVMASVAVFLALGGGAYAAVKLPKNSVQAKQIAKGAVRSSEVKDRSLLRRDFKAGSLPAGERGPQGDPGQPGPGAVKLYFDRGSDDETVTLGSVGPWTIKARCAVGGATVPAIPQVLIDGPGGADIADTDSINGGTPVASVRHQDLTAGSEVFSVGVKSPDVSRRVGTIVLSAGPDAAVGQIAFVLVADNSQPGGHCTFIGTATLGG